MSKQEKDTIAELRLQLSKANHVIDALNGEVFELMVAQKASIAAAASAAPIRSRSGSVNSSWANSRRGSLNSRNDDFGANSVSQNVNVSGGGLSSSSGHCSSGMLAEAAIAAATAVLDGGLGSNTLDAAHFPMGGQSLGGSIKSAAVPVAPAPAPAPVPPPVSVPVPAPAAAAPLDIAESTCIPTEASDGSVSAADGHSNLPNGDKSTINPPPTKNANGAVGSADASSDQELDYSSSSASDNDNDNDLNVQDNDDDDLSPEEKEQRNVQRLMLALGLSKQKLVGPLQRHHSAGLAPVSRKKRRHRKRAASSSSSSGNVGTEIVDKERVSVPKKHQQDAATDGQAGEIQSIGNISAIEPAENDAAVINASGFIVRPSKADILEAMAAAAKEKLNSASAMMAEVNKISVKHGEPNDSLEEMKAEGNDCNAAAGDLKHEKDQPDRGGGVTSAATQCNTLNSDIRSEKEAAEAAAVAGVVIDQLNSVNELLVQANRTLLAKLERATQVTAALEEENSHLKDVINGRGTYYANATAATALDNENRDSASERNGECASESVEKPEPRNDVGNSVAIELYRSNKLLLEQIRTKNAQVTDLQENIRALTEQLAVKECELNEKTEHVQSLGDTLLFVHQHLLREAADTASGAQHTISELLRQSSFEALNAETVRSEWLRKGSSRNVTKRVTFVAEEDNVDEDVGDAANKRDLVGGTSNIVEQVTFPQTFPSFPPSPDKSLKRYSSGSSALRSKNGQSAVLGGGDLGNASLGGNVEDSRIRPKQESLSRIKSASKKKAEYIMIDGVFIKTN